MIKVALALILALIVATASGSPRSMPIATSPKALIMGNAFTAVADDEFTLFYNPAALGRNRSMNLSLGNLNVSASNVLGETDRFKNLPEGDPAAFAERLLDFPMQLNLGSTPGFKMGSFGFNLIANTKTQFVLRNAIHPVLDLKYNYDKGFITGLAFGFGRGKINSQDERWYRKRLTRGYRVSFGVGLKYIEREGVDTEFDLFGSKILNQITNGELSLSSMKNMFGFSEGKGLGFDLGTELTVTNGRSNLTMGLAILDVGDTKFDTTSGAKDLQNQKMAINSGIAFRQDFTAFDVTLSSDIKPINQQRDLMGRFNLGLEVALPMLSVFTGWSEGYVSYGAIVRVWPLKFTAGMYGHEIGAHYSHKQSKNLVLHVSLFDFSFDL